jgi:hypothetical protein
MEDRAEIRDLEIGRGRRILVLILAVLALAIVLGAVAAGFRGRKTNRGARALTDPSAAKKPERIAPSIPSHL